MSSVSDLAAPDGPIEGLSSSIRDWLGKLAETTGLSPTPLPPVFASVFLWLLVLHFLLFSLNNNSWITGSKNIKAIINDAYSFVKNNCVRVLLSYATVTAGYMSAGGGIDSEISAVLNVLSWMFVTWLVYSATVLLNGKYVPGGVDTGAGKPLRANQGGFLRALYLFVGWIQFLTREILFESPYLGFYLGTGVFPLFITGLFVAKFAGR